MKDSGLDVVTGAFGYTGRHIARRLLAMDRRVRTLTGRPDREDPFGGRVGAAHFDFEHPDRLARSLEGAAVLYNTYWVRFPRGKVTFERAVANTEVLLRAAEAAGVGRIVHVSITNPSEDSPLPYFRGKALVEKAVRGSGLGHAILRPTVVFGPEDILVNNIAWFLRRFPLFAIPGSGDYRLQPVFVEDLAALAVGAAERPENLTLDAVGPDILTFRELVRLVAEAVGSRARIVRVPPSLALLASRAAGLAVRDVVLTRDELSGLMGDLLVSSGPPAGSTRLGDWLRENAARLGTRYASELDRHYRARPER